MQQVKMKNVAVIALAVLLVVFLWYRMVYSSMESQANKADQAAHDAKARTDSLQAQLSKLTGGSAKQKASADELNRAIPLTPELSNFLRSLQQVRDAAGIPAAFQTIQPSPPASVGGSTSISLTITVQGGYAQIIDYVNRLDKLKRMVLIDSVQMTAGAADGAVSTGGAPTGQVFAGQGAPPQLSVQIGARLLTQAAPVATSGRAAAVPVAAPAPTPSK